jgi:hypothetical protein
VEEEKGRVREREKRGEEKRREEKREERRREEKRKTILFTSKLDLNLWKKLVKW